MNDDENLINEKIVAYKGFSCDWKCRDFQFAVGETYTHDGDVEACESGFHACEYPLDVFRYYVPANNQFAEVEQSGQMSRHDEDSKIASSTISIKASIDLHVLINAAINYTFSRVKPEDGAALNCGERGAASNSGPKGAALNSGWSGAALNCGERGAASNSGPKGAALNCGLSGAASNSGPKGAALNSGWGGAASNSGESGAASNSGRWGAASNSGEMGTASNSGERGAASNSGVNGVAADFSGTGRAKSCASGAIVCIKRGKDGTILHIRASKVGENGIKPNAWYMLDEQGDFVEARNE